MLDIPTRDAAFRYSGFISYSRHDARQAERLQTALERFRMPARLVGIAGAHGPVPDRLRPLFLDRSELTAASDLNEQLHDAIVASQWMIVICTPWAATSEWVDREIRLMQAEGRGGQILPALFDGDERNAFPPALRQADGQPVIPLAADFRRGGDGRRLATLKLVSAMTGVGLGDLVHRESHRRQRRLAGVAALSAAGMVAFAAVSIMAVRAQRAAEFERARSEAMVETLITDLRAAVKPLGSLKALGVINQAAADYFQDQPLDGLSDEALAQRARLLIAMGEDEVERGSMATARTHFEEAHRITAQRLAAAPDDADRMLDHATSEFWLGREAWSAGDARRARAAWTRYRALALALLAKQPDNPDWLLEAGYAETNIGILDLRASMDLPMAERRFESALSHYRQALQLQPAHDSAALDLADGLAWLADSYRLHGRLAEANVLRAERRALLERHLADDPGSYHLAQQLLFNQIAVGRIADAERRHSDAAGIYREAAIEAERLLAKDPLNAVVSGALAMARLFAMRSDLLGADRARAIRTEIAECALLRRAANPAEVEDWCRLVVARRAAMVGEFGAAETHLAAVTARQLRPEGPKLSDRFGLDFAAEVAAVRAIAGKELPGR